MKKTRGIPTIFQHQADATLSQANPVSGTKYTVLDTTENVRVIGISATVTWTVQPSPLEIHVTVDGQSYTFAQTDPVTATPYYSLFSLNAVETAQIMTNDNEIAQRKAFLFEGRSVKVEVETTGGTVSNLSGRVRYAKIP